MLNHFPGVPFHLKTRTERSELLADLTHHQIELRKGRHWRFSREIGLDGSQADFCIDSGDDLLDTILEGKGGILEMITAAFLGDDPGRSHQMGGSTDIVVTIGLDAAQQQGDQEDLKPIRLGTLRPTNRRCRL